MIDEIRQWAIPNVIYCDEGDFLRAREFEFNTTTTSQTVLLRRLAEHGPSLNVPHPRLWHKLSPGIEIPFPMTELLEERTRLTKLLRKIGSLGSGTVYLSLLPDSRTHAVSAVVYGVLEDLGCSVVHSNGAMDDGELLEVYSRYQCSGIVGSAPRLCRFMYCVNYLRSNVSIVSVVGVGSFRRNQRRFIRHVRKSNPPSIIHLYGSVLTGIFAASSAEETELHYEPSWFDIKYFAIQPEDYTTRETVKYLHTFEHQRLYPVVGWLSQMAPGDRDTWSTEDGKTLRRDQVQVPPGWSTVGDWAPDETGWQYASALDGPWTSSAGDAKVRRKKWLRRVELIKFDVIDVDLSSLSKLSVTSVTRRTLPVFQVELRDFGVCKTETSFLLTHEAPIPFRFCGLKFLTDEFSEVVSRFLDCQIIVGPTKLTFYCVHDPNVFGIDVNPVEIRHAASQVLAARLARGRAEGLIPEDFILPGMEGDSSAVEVFIVPYCEFQWDPIDHSIPRVVMTQS